MDIGDLIYIGLFALTFLVVRLIRGEPTRRSLIGAAVLAIACLAIAVVFAVLPQRGETPDVGLLSSVIWIPIVIAAGAALVIVAGWFSRRRARPPSTAKSPFDFS